RPARYPRLAPLSGRDLRQGEQPNRHDQQTCEPTHALSPTASWSSAPVRSCLADDPTAYIIVARGRHGQSLKQGGVASTAGSLSPFAGTEGRDGGRFDKLSLAESLTRSLRSRPLPARRGEESWRLAARRRSGVVVNAPR